MSVALPVCAVVFGSVAPPQADVLELRAHLGCTDEVSSFECLLQNFDKKYGSGGSYPIDVGVDGSVSLGRGVNCPLVATVTVEEIKAQSSATGGNYLRVLGRCWGERLFRRVVTKTYENLKGETIVKDIIDNFVGLSHVRNSVELVENTDTTYTKLEYENTPAFDILKYIAKTADLGGAIGFDFRVAPDGKFEFFSINSKTSSVNLSERLEVSEYRRSIFRKRDKVMVFGAAEKKYPSDGDAWTETLDINTDMTNDWVSGTGTGNVSLDGANKAAGSYSIKHTTSTPDYYGRLRLIIPSGWQPNLNKHLTLQFQIRRESAFSGQATISLVDNVGKWVSREFQVAADKWYIQKLNAGKKYANEWQGADVASFNWEIVNEVLWDVHFSGTGTGSFWVDNLFFNSARWNATYGTGSREMAETDEELHSDNECLLRAKALHEYLSSPSEYIRVYSDVIDCGATPILAGDKTWITLPNENVDGYYHVTSVEYRLVAETQALETVLELGKEPPLLADYLYALRSKTGSLSRYKVGRI
jgi:hypothetical protein